MILLFLVDEGHRSQGGENYIRMKQALPNAAFIAFTGTPLLKEDKTTNKFWVYHPRLYHTACSRR
ncbi:DEAD/DEAH box helicase family protein [Legionella pneumophila]|uniref:DEAD/DEAH box helicase family protein n=1 Tax=Legionella pneumophila TaxID=446 RepID=UPI0015C57E3A|nr:DEAD/DEAH box helicase family protein [Legionella pneumophila]